MLDKSICNKYNYSINSNKKSYELIRNTITVKFKKVEGVREMRSQEEKLYANPLLDENAVDKAPGAGYHNPLQESRESRNEEAVLASCKCKKNDPNDMAPEAPAEEKTVSEVKAEMYANPLLDENAVDKAPGAGYHNPLQESRESRNEEAVLASCKCKKN